MFDSIFARCRGRYQRRDIGEANPPAQIRTERPRLWFHFFDTLERDLHRLDEALLIEFHPVNARDAMISISFPEWTPMIDDVINILARQLNHRVMTGAGGDCGILLQNFSNSLKRSEW